MPDVPLLVLQLATVLIAARAVGFVFRHLGQPQVVGEMFAGIMLGPSLLGWVAPAAEAALFPPASLGFLSALSQIGLIILMFLVGLELSPRLLRGAGRVAVVVGPASMIVPFGLGAALALRLYPRFADPSASASGFALFMGAAMSVTAFPVLARILIERGLVRTRVGTAAIACAAINDVAAWCLLAAVVVIARAPTAALPLGITLAGSAAYVGLMLWGVRPLARSLEIAHRRRGTLSQDVLTVVVLLTLGSAWATERLGIHALFGAFLTGVVLPKGPAFVRDLRAKLEDITVVLLLPLFFAETGLRTSVGQVGGAEMWLTCASIILVAIAGKLGGSAAAARAGGLDWRSAGALGALMNTRGLVELVILKVGLDLRVLSPALYTMMVLMALVTTCMTTPLVAWLYPSRLIQRLEPAEDEGEWPPMLRPDAPLVTSRG